MNSKITSRSLSTFLFLIFGALSAHAAVTDWWMDKGVDYLQTADNTQPTIPTNWFVCVDLETDLANDATSVVIEGGNISGSMALEQSGTEWELCVDYATQAEMDAVFPSSSSYSIILSGGTMGSVTQQFNIATDAYPTSPYLTGADYSTFQAIEVFEPFEANWNSPTGLVSAIGLEILEGSFSEAGDTIFEVYSDSSTTNTLLPTSLFVAGSNYIGDLFFSNPTLASGAGGFGVDGGTAFSSDLLFPIAAVNTASGYDDFNDNSMDPAKWSLLGAELGDAFAETETRLNYTSPGAGDSFVAWSWEASSLSYTQDWSIAVDVTDLISTNAFSGDEEVFLGLLIMAEGDLDNNISSEFISSSFGREAAAFASKNGVEVISDQFVFVTNETISLKISFDAQTKILYSAYSTGGDYMIHTSYSAAQWGMTDSSAFNPVLFAGNELFEVTNGLVYADNFRIYADPVALSNHVELLELEYLHSFGDGTIFLPGNFIQIDAETSHRVNRLAFTSPGGDRVEVTSRWNEGTTAGWETDVEFPFLEAWDSANDGDWIVSFGFTDGTVRSTVIPFTKEDGTTPLPVFLNQPEFLSPSPLANTTTNVNEFSFQWSAAHPEANVASLDDVIGDDDPGDFSVLFADARPGPLSIIPDQITGSLSTTNHGPVILQREGLHRIRLNNGYAHGAYNSDGIAYIVAKLSEHDLLFTIVLDGDADQVPDAWELTFFGSTNAVNGGANDDFDGDGLLNIEEYIAGVNPTNSGSVFGVEQAEPIPAGFVVNWNSVGGRKYGVYWAKTLSDGFVTVATDLPYPQNSYTDTVHTVEGCGFYYINVQLAE